MIVRCFPAFLLLLGLAASGCGAKVYDAGSNDAPGAEPTAVVRSYPPPSDSFGCVPGDPACYGMPCTGSPPAEIAGVWTGTFDDYALPSGSRAVRVEVLGDQSFSPGLCGAVTLGDGSPPPLPTGPDETSWPPDYDVSVVGALGTVTRSRLPYEGFRYEFYDATVDQGAQKVLLGIMSGQLYKAYCDMQTSYLQSTIAQRRYECVPPHEGSGSGPGDSCAVYTTATPSVGIGGECTAPGCTRVGCQQLLLCENDPGCDCDNVGCTVNYVPDSTFDLQLDGDTATGQVSLDDGIHALHLTRGQ